MRPLLQPKAAAVTGLGRRILTFTLRMTDLVWKTRGPRYRPPSVGLRLARGAVREDLDGSGVDVLAVMAAPHQERHLPGLDVLLRDPDQHRRHHVADDE